MFSGSHRWGFAAGQGVSVGVLYDYFRAADRDAVVEMMTVTGGHSPLVCEGGDAAADVVETKWIDPQVVLGQVVAMALDEPSDVDLAGGPEVWPEGPDLDGPWVVAITERARDALADIGSGRLPDLARRWARIEELSWLLRHNDVDFESEMESLLRDLVGLARRAQSAQEGLYCWICL